MKIINVGRNYAEHARELGNEVPREPLIFVKPKSAFADAKAPIIIPTWTTELHHEVELVVEVSKVLSRVNPDVARKAMYRVSLGLDLTARDLQRALKDAGHPWERAKAFDGAARVGPMMTVDESFWETDHSIELLLNGASAQFGHLSGMMCQPAELISSVSEWMTLEPGDLVFTGTPPGVGPLAVGDELVARLDGQAVFATSVVSSPH